MEDEWKLKEIAKYIKWTNKGVPLWLRGPHSPPSESMSPLPQWIIWCNQPKADNESEWPWEGSYFELPCSHLLIVLMNLLLPIKPLFPLEFAEILVSFSVM